MLALAAEGTTDALIMLVIVILANGLLQNIVQPIAFGATLDLNPLVVLIVTIGFGSIFGMIGMILAAPLTSAALHISRELPLRRSSRPRPPRRASARRPRRHRRRPHAMLDAFALGTLAQSSLLLAGLLVCCDRAAAARRSARRLPAPGP